MITIDFRKAFDTVEFSAISGVLDYFGFGPYIKKLIFLLYKGFHTKVSHNGTLTPSFAPERAIHQGCAASGYIFVLIVETPAHLIKQDPDIKPIIVNGESDVISQYIDDTTIFIMYDPTLLEKVIRIFQQFADNTGLAVNFEKSVIHKIGSARNMPNLTLSQPFKWTSDPICILGIDLNDQNGEDTITSIIDKMKSIIQVWRRRSLTIIGKVQIVNSLLGSLLVYPLQVLPLMSKQNVHKINKLIADFIWNGRKPKIRNQSLQLSKSQAGLALFIPHFKDIALKIAWIPRLNKLDSYSYQLAMYSIQPSIRNTEFWYTNTKPEDIDYICKASGFWRDVVVSWLTINYHEVEPDNQDMLLQEHIWYNSHVRKNNKPFIVPQLADKGCFRICDILNRHGNFMSLVELNNTYCTNINFLDYQSLLHAIPKNWTKALQLIELGSLNLDSGYAHLIDEILEVEKPSKYAYSKLIEAKDFATDLQNKWNGQLNAQDIQISLKYKKSLQSQSTKVFNIG